MILFNDIVYIFFTRSGASCGIHCSSFNSRIVTGYALSPPTVMERGFVTGQETKVFFRKCLAAFASLTQIKINTIIPVIFKKREERIKFFLHKAFI